MPASRRPKAAGRGRAAPSASRSKTAPIAPAEDSQLVSYQPLTQEQLDSAPSFEIEVDDWTGQHGAHEEHRKKWRGEVLSKHPAKSRVKKPVSATKDSAVTAEQDEAQAVEPRQPLSEPPQLPRSDWLELREGGLDADSPATDTDTRAASAAPDLCVFEAPLLRHQTTPRVRAEVGRSPLSGTRYQSSAVATPGPSMEARSPLPERPVQTPGSSASRKASYGSLFSVSDEPTGTAESSSAGAQTSRRLQGIELQERDWAQEPTSPMKDPRPKAVALKSNGKGKTKAPVDGSQTVISSDDDDERQAEKERKLKEKKLQRKKREREEEMERERIALKAKKKKKKKKNDKEREAERQPKASSSSKPHKSRGGEVDDLRSNINADAFARSTAPSTRKDFSSHLKKLQQARKGIVVDSDADDGSQSSDDSSSTSSVSSSSGSSSGSSAFVVGDDEIIHESGKVVKKKMPAPTKRQRSPMTLGSVLGRKLDFGEACEEYLRWITMKILSTVTQLPRPRQEELRKARQHLQQYVEDSRRNLSSSVMRRQFTWYLTHYPNLDRRLLFSSEVQDHRGCSACHRSKQKCDSELSFGGRLYNRDTLEFLDTEDEDQMSSDMSSNAEDVVEHRSAKDPSITFKRRTSQKGRLHVFLCGSFCANRAVLLHSLTHWEYQTLGRVFKAEECKAIRIKHERGGDVTEREIEKIVRMHVDKLKRDLTSYRRQATEIAKK